MVIAALVVGILLGWATGGRLSTLQDTHIRGEGALLAAFIGQLVLPFMSRTLHDVELLTYILWLVSFIVMLAVALANVKNIGLMVVAIGVISNLTAIVSNGSMPVSGLAMYSAGYEGDLSLAFTGNLSTHQLLGSDSSLAILGDVMPLPGPQFIQGVVSMGDVFLIVGIVIYLVGSMTGYGVNRQASDCP